MIKGTAYTTNPITVNNGQAETVERTLLLPLIMVIPNYGPPVFKAPPNNIVVTVGLSA